MARRKTYGFSFSWKRALGVTSAKQRIARATGIPTTRAGRQRKVGRMMGCMVYVVGIMLLAVIGVILLFI